MTRGKAIEILKNLPYLATKSSVEDIERAICLAINALSQEPCDDAISRDAVLKLKHHKPEYGDMIYAFDVEQLPSVTPQHKECRIMVKFIKEQTE